MPQLSIAAHRRIFWIGASLVAGVIMLFVADSKGLFHNPDTRVFEVSVFFAAWLAIVFLLRAYSKRFRRVEDITPDNLR
jgi:Flp pilus assembly protein TadB